jgi:hypothetical protein
LFQWSSEEYDEVEKARAQAQSLAFFQMMESVLTGDFQHKYRTGLTMRFVLPSNAISSAIDLYFDTLLLTSIMDPDP